MHIITVRQLYKFFLQALDHCGAYLLKGDTEDIEYYLFEEFDGECISFLHINSLNRLLDNRYISAEVYSLCQLLYEKFRKMENTNLWNADCVKTSPEWHEILFLSDKIKSMINRPDA